MKPLHTIPLMTRLTHFNICIKTLFFVITLNVFQIFSYKIIVIEVLLAKLVLGQRKNAFLYECRNTRIGTYVNLSWFFYSLKVLYT